MLATLREDADVGDVDDWRWTGPADDFDDWCERLGATGMAARAAQARGDEGLTDRMTATASTSSTQEPFGNGAVVDRATFGPSVAVVRMQPARAAATR